MAKKSGGSKAAGSKKWLLILAALVLIAVVVTIVLVSLPKNTGSAASQLKSVSQTSFLQSEKEKNKHQQAYNKISTSSALNYYSQEFADMTTLSDSISDLLDFYNEYLIFAQNNKVLKKNYKAIKNNLQTSVSIQRNLNSTLDDMIALAENSDTHLKNLVIEFRKEYADYLNEMESAIESLNKVMNGCFEGKFIDNRATEITLAVVDDFMSVITDEFDSLVDKDKKGYTALDYSYQSHGKIVVFDQFVSAWFDGEDMTEYYFDKTVSDKYQKIDQYYTLFGQKNFESMIKSIQNTNNPDITITFEITDTDGVLNAVKNFVKGGE